MPRLPNQLLRVAALSVLLASAATGMAHAADCGADPAVVKFSYNNIVPTIAGEMATYTFDFVATLQNVGNKDYASTPGAQSFEITGDGTSLASVDFPALAAGASVDVTARITNWSPMDGTQKFVATANYKTPGGDCSADDNSKTIAAEDLEPLLRGQ